LFVSATILVNKVEYKTQVYEHVGIHIQTHTCLLSPQLGCPPAV